MSLKWSYLSQVAAVVCLQLNRFLWLFFSDELSSRDPERYGQADGNYPGSSSTHPSYPGQISLLMITFCPPSFLTAFQLKVVFLWCLPCRVAQGGWVLLRGLPHHSSMGAPSLSCYAAEPNDCHLYDLYSLCKFFLKLYIHLLKIANFLCLCIKRAFKCRFSALHIKLC